MGYNRSEIEESLASSKYDDVFATYLLLGRKSSDVSMLLHILDSSNVKERSWFPYSIMLLLQLKAEVCVLSFSSGYLHFFQNIKYVNV
jgi:hypothetical protein